LVYHFKIIIYFTYSEYQTVDNIPFTIESNYLGSQPHSAIMSNRRNVSGSSESSLNPSASSFNPQPPQSHSNGILQPQTPSQIESGIPQPQHPAYHSTEAQQAQQPTQIQPQHPAQVDSGNLQPQYKGPLNYRRFEDFERILREEYLGCPNSEAPLTAPAKINLELEWMRLVDEAIASFKANLPSCDGCGELHMSSASAQMLSKLREEMLQEDVEIINKFMIVDWTWQFEDIQFDYEADMLASSASCERGRVGATGFASSNL
jgi:hypothetical protein